MNRSKLQFQSHFYFLILLAVVSACSEPVNDDLAELQVRLDSLKQVRNEVEQEILAVEEKIDLLDTTIEKALVTTYSVEEGVFKHYFEVYGNVQTDQTATLYPESTGLVMDISVEEGQEVSKGQVLLKLDTELIEKNIAELETSLDLASTLFEKQQRLWEQNIGSEVQYLEAKNRKESLENGLETLKEQKRKATVRAPFSGVVDKIFPKVGEMANMQTPVARLVSLNGLYITADVTERYVNDIAQGDSALIVIARQDTLQGVIERVGRYINPTNRTFEIKVLPLGSNAKLLPNSLVGLKINDHTLEEAITLPASMIMQDGTGRDYAYVLSEDEHKRKIATKRPVMTGLSYEGQTVIKRGLEPGDVVIDRGARTVRNGDLVETTTI
jgi:RND family efflux transporter MFP subunit